MKLDWIDWLTAPFAPFVLIWWTFFPPSGDPYPPDHYHRLK